MPLEKILFVYFNAGGGHRVVAEAVAEALREGSSDRFDVRTLDFFGEGRLPRIEAVTRDLYNDFLVRHPLLYTLYYHLGNVPAVIRILHRIFVDARFWQHIHGILERNHPRMCVLVNPHLCDCFSRLSSREGRTLPLVNLISDPFSVHSLWISPGADFTIVFSEEARRRLVRKGIARSRIHLFDYPVRKAFSQRTHCREEILERHAFSSHRLTILIHAGWHNARKVLEIARRLLQEGWPVQAFVVLGKRNPKGWKPPADRVSGESGVRLFDYAQNMDELMAASDLVVCKAGPAMIFEAINLRKPLVLLSYLSGQEEGNKRFVVAGGFGWYCPSTDTFLTLLRRILRDRSLLEEKRAALERSGIDNGSPQIARFLMDVLSRGDPSLGGTGRGGP